MKAINKHTVSVIKRDDQYKRFFNDMRNVKTDYSKREQAELIKEYKKTGCIAVRNKIVEANLLFCAKCAKVYVQEHVPTMSFGDLLSISTEGIIYALDKFDPTTGYKLISYAVNWIRQYITIYIQAKSRIIKQHSHCATVYKVVGQLKDRGQEITPEAVYKLISKGSKRKFTMETIKDVLLTMKVASMDQKRVGYEFETLGDSIGTEELSPDANMKNNDMHSKLLSCMHHLKQKEQDVLNMYFGVNGYTPTSYPDIAYRLGLTVEAVRQRYKIAIKRLRYYMKKGGMQKKLF